jgi:hypothetical protein
MFLVNPPQIVQAETDAANDIADLLVVELSVLQSTVPAVIAQSRSGFSADDIVSYPVSAER